MPRPTLSIIGFGAFGQLMARDLAPHLDLSVLDPCPKAQAEAAGRGLPVIGIDALARADLVLLAVPLPALAACLTGIAPHLRPGQMVVDVCSVKSEPAQMMRDLLPPGVMRLGTHPMFGPHSAAAGLTGHQIVLCPDPGSPWRRIAAFLRHVLRLRVIVTTPEDHDRQVALSQGVTHLLARALASLGPAPMIRTRSFDLMMAGLAMVQHDAPEVFAAITRANPHMPALRRQLLAALDGA